MKSKRQVTKASAAKLEAMKRIKTAYKQAKQDGKVKTYQVTPA